MVNYCKKLSLYYNRKSRDRTVTDSGFKYYLFSKLGIRLLYAKPYSPESTGKVEKFNQTVDKFLAEAELEKPKTLDRLNELFQIWAK